MAIQLKRIKRCFGRTKGWDDLLKNVSDKGEDEEEEDDEMIDEKG